MKQSIKEVTHEIANDLYKSGVIDAKTMREYDELCVPEVKELSPSQIKRIRLKEKVSQALFAKYLNTSVSTVRQWEQGERHPQGIALRILNKIGRAHV